jgi:hypothetical protein
MPDDIKTQDIPAPRDSYAQVDELKRIISTYAQLEQRVAALENQKEAK